jgi:predicted transcriptional regulator
MKTISLKIDDAIFDDTENILESIQKPRNRYINEAIALYNKMNKKSLLAKKLILESKLVADNSVEVLKEFEDFEYEN